MWLRKLKELTSGLQSSSSFNSHALLDHLSLLFVQSNLPCLTPLLFILGLWHSCGTSDHLSLGTAVENTLRVSAVAGEVPI